MIFFTDIHDVVFSAFPATELSVAGSRASDEGNLGSAGSANFIVKLSGPSRQTVTVNYATADGTTGGAKAGQDYIAKRGTLTFAPGQTVKIVKVDFIGDDVAENDESLLLDLHTPVNAHLGVNRAVANIRNDDGPRISINNAPIVAEGNQSTHPQVFTVRLSAASTSKVTVDWATANNTADTADYVAASGTLIFAPGQTSKLIVVQIIGDAEVEKTESYRVNLSNPKLAVISDGQGAGFIGNDDAAPPLFFDDAPSE